MSIIKFGSCDSGEGENIFTWKTPWNKRSPVKPFQPKYETMIGDVQAKMLPTVVLIANKYLLLMKRPRTAAGRFITKYPQKKELNIVLRSDVFQSNVYKAEQEL